MGRSKHTVSKAVVVPPTLVTAKTHATCIKHHALQPRLANTDCRKKTIVFSEGSNQSLLRLTTDVCSIDDLPHDQRKSVYVWSLVPVEGLGVAGLHEHFGRHVPHRAVPRALARAGVDLVVGPARNDQIYDWSHEAVTELVMV